MRRPYLADQVLDLREHAADDYVHARRGRMEAVSLIERTVAHDAVGDERIENEVVRGCQFRIDRVECLGIIFTMISIDVIARDPIR